MEYKTQMEAAKKGIVTKELAAVAKKEGFTEAELLPLVASGRVIIPANVRHKSLDPNGVGEGLRTKINVNLGISGDCADYCAEMQKVQLAVQFGAEAIMDLSNYGKTREFREKLIEYSPAMVGTVPVYDAVGYLEKDLMDMTAQDFLKVVRAHAEEGVDFMTIHAGINRRAVEGFERSKRKMNIVSRGGSLLFAWMKMTGNENPFYEYYDEVMDILREYDVTISLGDALRPGCLDDATDAGQIGELIELGNLTQRAWEKDVQVMVEGPGHMAMDEIAANMKMEKRLCHGAPFYVLGPLVTDIAPDTITSRRPSAAQSRRPMARTFCAMSPLRSICVCQTSPMCAKGLSPQRLPPMRRTSRRACAAHASRTTRWRRHASVSTGMHSSAWPSTEKRRRRIMRAFPLQISTAVPCAAKCARFAQPTAFSMARA